MNTASQDLPRHLDILRQKLTHPTDYDRALAYFLEEFAGDEGFHDQGHQDDASHLRFLMGIVACQLLQRQTQIEDFGAFFLPGHGFFHGRASVDGAYLIFFYFEKINKGLATLMGLKGPEQLLARWQLPERLPRNPKHN